MPSKIEREKRDADILKHVSRGFTPAQMASKHRLTKTRVLQILEIHAAADFATFNKRERDLIVDVRKNCPGLPLWQAVFMCRYFGGL